MKKTQKRPLLGWAAWIWIAGASLAFLWQFRRHMETALNLLGLA
ncbi:MAG: hypothetical protein ACPGNT_00430 [Rhodospirillales bacterium]